MEVVGLQRPRMLDAVIVPIAHVGGGVFSPLQVTPPLLALAAYWMRARTLARQGRPVPPWRMACFGLGIPVILLALITPVAHIGGELILAHMAQHILMADLGALLLVFGLTGPLSSRCSPRPSRTSCACSRTRCRVLALGR